MVDTLNYEIFYILFYAAFSKSGVGCTLKHISIQNSYNSSVRGPRVAAILFRFSFIYIMGEEYSVGVLLL